MDIGYNYPKADYLSSSRKRLVPQLMFKGGILNSWGKKIGIVLHESFYNTLPKLPEVEVDKADAAWFIYGLDFSEKECVYNLVKRKAVYTKFNEALNSISIAMPGKLEDFIGFLQGKLDEKLENRSSPETINPIDLLKNREATLF